jgi:arylformamidase
MILHEVTDWNNAYANGANIPGGDRWPKLWADAAGPFRERLTAEGRARLDIEYGTRPRNRVDMFFPEGKPKGLVAYIHGGFWRMLDKSFGSHLAASPLAHGYAVAMPGYTLTPDVRVAEIGREIAAAIELAADTVAGPINLTGHSAGGQLATRMVTTTSPLSKAVIGRVRNVVSISGLHDLRPMPRLAYNSDIGIDDAEAEAESPALLRPVEGTRLTCWVGQAERAEFVRQSELLANIWKGLGAATAFYAEPDKHHFNIIDGLADPNHPLVKALLA